MCLILVCWKTRVGMPLVVAANRDELHARAASPADFWQDQPAILAGRDLQANGTWLGLSREGRFAAVTNYRGGHDPKALESRGALVSGFLQSSGSAETYIADVSGKMNNYSGFNLLVADRDELWWLSNRGNGPRRLEPGCYALGNLLLDSPEVIEIRARFAGTTPAVEPLFSILAQAKIVAPLYGSRCSTILMMESSGRTQFAERPFGTDGAAGSTLRFEFRRPV